MAPASDMGAVIGAFEGAIRAGNPTITQQEAAAIASWVTLTQTGVSSWPAFERGALTWTLNMVPKTGEYRMRHYDPSKGGGWTPEPVPVFTLPADTPISEVIRRAARAVCDAAKRPSQP